MIHRHPLLSLLLSAILITLAQPIYGDNIFVDAAAKGTGDGSSWTDAYTDLQTAIDAAKAGEMLLVAEGIYYPTKAFNPITGKVTSKPSNGYLKSFYLTKEIMMYGGYPSQPAATENRDWQTNLTILSGDIDQNDITVGGIVQDPKGIKGTNAGIVLIITTAGAPVLDGLVFTAGNNVYGSYGGYGGGVYNYAAAKTDLLNPQFRNCSFTGNHALNGGGAMANVATNGGYSAPVITNCVFSHNTATHGGAIYSTGSYGTLNITDARFVGNSARGGGGALYFINLDSAQQVLIDHSSFQGNTAQAETLGQAILLQTAKFSSGHAQPRIEYSSITMSSSYVFGSTANPFAINVGYESVDAMYLDSTYVEGALKCPVSSICDAATRKWFSSGAEQIHADAETKPHIPQGLGPRTQNPHF
jgi:predicted outer membrane repeat protein